MQAMYPKAIIAVLLAAFLVFGCTGPSGPSGGAAQGGQQQPAGTGGQQGGGQQTGGNGNQPSGTNTLAGLAYGELMALGVPIQCDILTTSGENPVTAKLYKGTGPDIRVESPASGGPCATMVSLMKGDKYYVGCEQGEVMPGCQWLVFSQTASSGTPGASYQKPDYSDMPPSQISCAPWIFDASKLEAPANACSLDDLMHNIPTE